MPMMMKMMMMMTMAGFRQLAKEVVVGVMALYFIVRTQTIMTARTKSEKSERFFLQQTTLLFVPPPSNV